MGSTAGIERHPWNRDFAWRDHDRVPSTLTPTQVRASTTSRASWWCPTCSMPSRSPRSVAEIDRYEAEMDAVLRAQEDDRLFIAEAGAITFSVPPGGPLAGAAPALAAHPTIVGICRDLIGPDVRLYWDQAVYKKPEKPRRFPWHQDNGYTFVEPQQYLTMLARARPTRPWTTAARRWCPASTGRARCATATSTRSGYECLEDPDEVVAAPVPAGGIGGVLVAHAAPHRPEHDRPRCARPTSSSTPPTVPRPCGATPMRVRPCERVRCDDPDRQYPVLVGGDPVSPPGGAT